MLIKFSSRTKNKVLWQIPASTTLNLGTTLPGYCFENWLLKVWGKHSTQCYKDVLIYSMYVLPLSIAVDGTVQLIFIIYLILLNKQFNYLLIII